MWNRNIIMIWISIYKYMPSKIPLDYMNLNLFPVQVLTLASNERIPLNPTMRLLFEISHLKTATPATVSKAGILFINPADLGWNPWVWLA